MKQKHIKSLYATLRTKQSKVNKSGLEFAWLKLEITNVSSGWRQKWAHQKWRGSPAELGIYPPFPLGAGHEGPGTVGTGTSQALKAVGGSKFPIRWSVTSNNFRLCLLHRSPWLSPWDCPVSLSCWNSPLQLGQTRYCCKKEVGWFCFFFQLHLLKHLAQTGTYLAMKIYIPSSMVLHFCPFRSAWHDETADAAAEPAAFQSAVVKPRLQTYT